MTDMPLNISTVLHQWLENRLDAPQLTWLREKLGAVSTGDRKALFFSFGLVPRRLGKKDLELSVEERSQADQARPGWNPQNWSVDQVARLSLVLAFPADDGAAMTGVLDPLFNAGEVQELIALYQGLPLYPFPEAHRLRCAEGLRTNIPAVFRAIAHGNPYPAEQLTDDQWNQMVLKCQFIGAALDPIVALDRRANSALARMLIDFARERRAAGRNVSPELWRCVGPFLDEAAIDEIQRVLQSGESHERQAVCLALSAGSVAPTARSKERAKELLDASGISTSKLSWSQFSGT